MTSPAAPGARAADPARALRAALDGALVGQRDAKTGLLLALVAREHAYLEGPPGCGKSRLAAAAAAAASSRRAALRFHRDTRADDLVGDTVLRREAAGPGRERLRRDREPAPLADAAVAVLDDVSRAPGEALAPLLRVLRERRLEGRALPLETAIATSLPPELDAYADPLEPTQLDRFAVQVRMTGLLFGRDWRGARAALDAVPAFPAAPVVTESQRAVLQQTAARLPVPAPVRGALLDVLARLREAMPADERGLLSDRSFGVAAVRIARAHATLRGAGAVAIEDLRALRFMLGRRAPPAVARSLESVIDAVAQGLPPSLQRSGRTAALARPGGGRAGPGVAPSALGLEDRALARGPAGHPHAPADARPLLQALEGRLERGRVDALDSPGGVPRAYRPLRRLDEVGDADALEAVLFAEGRLPGGPRVYRRRRREGAGALAVLRDVSASMEGSLSRWAGQVVTGIVKLAARRHMRVGYLEFNHDAIRYRVSGAFFHRRYRRIAALASVPRAEGRTSYQAPLAAALAELRGRPGRNRHLVLLTDGIPVLGDPSVRAERELAGRLGVRIHTVFLGHGACPPVLDALSRETGGVRFAGRPDASGLRLVERA